MFVKLINRWMNKGPEKKLKIKRTPKVYDTLKCCLSSNRNLNYWKYLNY